MVKNKYHVPPIDDLFDQFQGSLVYSKIDLQFGYHLLKILAKNVPKTTFRTRYSHCNFTMMLFRLTNILVAFIDMTNRVFQPYLDQFVVIFIDDILIYSRSDEKHANNTQRVLQLLQENKLYAKFKKYEF